MVWRRELIRFARTRTRILTSLAQPILFLFVLGYGMSALVGIDGRLRLQEVRVPRRRRR